MLDTVVSAKACKAFRTQVLLGFDFNGNDELPHLRHKVHFRSAFRRRPAIRVKTEIAHKLLAHILLRHGPFKMSEQGAALEYHGAIQLSERSQQTHIHAKQLERCLVHIRGQGHARCGNSIDLQNLIGVYEELQRIVEVTSTNALFHHAVYSFVSSCRKVRSNNVYGRHIIPLNNVFRIASKPFERQA